jgi:hypothetical protein
MNDREYQLKQAELGLKEREVSAREREVSARENESHIDWWKNPLILSVLGATLALLGTIFTSYCNNRAANTAEHLRAQSSLVLSVIKTNGNEEDACKNLNFFVRIGWLDDPNGAIHNSCGTKGEGGVPTLPASSGGSGNDTTFGLSQPFGIAATLSVRVEDADSHEPIANAKVDLEKPQGNLLPASPVTQSVVTDTNGLATLNFVSSYDSFTVSKDGYGTTKQPLDQVNLSSLSSIHLVTIELHRTPQSKR